MPKPEENPLASLPLDALEAALTAADTLMAHKEFMPRGGLLVMLVSRFRDDTRAAIGMEPERYATTTRTTGRGKVVRSLDDLTSGELAKVSAAVATLLGEHFAAVMDDPELPRLLRAFSTELDEQTAERRDIQASMAS